MMEPSIAQRGEENAEGKAAIAREAAGWWRMRARS